MEFSTVVSIGPFSAGALLGAGVALLTTAVPLYIRYVRRDKSKISANRFEELSDSNWRDGRDNSQPVWSIRIFTRLSNDWRRDGVVADCRLDRTVLTGPDGETVVDQPQASVHKIVFEHHATPETERRIPIDHPTGYTVVNGQDDEQIAVLPFILQDSELGRAMQQADSGRFLFVFTIEDNKRVYSVDLEISTDLRDSAGGALSRASE